MAKKNIAVIVGSIRKDSFTRKLALAARVLLPDALSLDIVEIAGLSFFNQDLEGAPPANWVRFREQIKASDGVLFMTPEYNRSIPGVLKNAIDVGSRPYGKSVFTGKPGAVIGVAPGALGAFGAVHHLRQCMVSNDMPMMAGPEAYIGNAGTLVGADGTITVDSTRTFLTGFLQSYDRWIARCGSESAG